ncbi:MAG TPA: DNA-3-methyladenine glycosylase [Candidatus Sulfotelmatobacter sp.]|jgi:DNA-3-methyladenine glycosylase|nr:DNA-3-methyladenine glycosylase [Candidatus Sulfotelmatobacter sp.]
MEIGRTARLRAAFYRRPPLTVARDLIGRTLCRRLETGAVVRGRLVEVEAYTGVRDLASHARFGLTRRNRWMWEDGGLAYVYLIYGMHHCLNVVTGDAGAPSAVLLRAAVLDGGEVVPGPGRLTRAFGIDRRLDGASFLTGQTLWIEKGEPVASRRIRRTPRIGVEYAGAWAAKPYRFVGEIL